MNRKSRFPLNMPEELHEVVKANASAVGITVNEYIVRCIQSYIGGATALEQRVSELEQIVKELQQLTQH